MMNTKSIELLCPACGSDDIHALPELKASMISDGKITKGLIKGQCCSCGLIQHLERLNSDQVAAIYEDEYSLPFLAGESDLKRSQAYSECILGELNKTRYSDNVNSVLDVGSGSGELML